MIRLRLRRLRDHRSDSGMSIVELLVTMILLGMILLMASSMYISVSQTTTHTQSVNEGTRIAANAMTEVSRVVRFGVENPKANSTPTPAFSEARKSKMTILTLSFAKASDIVTTRPMMPEMVSLILDGTGNLVEYRWNPQPSGDYWSFPAANLATADKGRVLGGKFLALGTTTPLFRYYSDDWDSAKSDYKELIPVGTGTLSSADLAKIRFVDVTVNTVPISRPDDEPVIVTNRIGLLNLVSTDGETP